VNIFEASDIIDKWDWVYAKSYDKTFPHSYAQRRKIADENEYESFLRLIRYAGRTRSFFSKQYIYLTIGEYEYWEMGRPIPCVQVINKAKIDISKDYKKTEVTPAQDLALKHKLTMREDYLEDLLYKHGRTPQEESIVKFLMDTNRRIHGGGKNILDHCDMKVRYE